MNRSIILLMGALLSAQLSACHSGLTGDLSQIPNQNGITPGPKGPKPTDGIVTLPDLTLPTQLSEIARNHSAINANSPTGGATMDPLSSQPISADIPQVEPLPIPPSEPTSDPEAQSSAAQQQTRGYFYFSYDDSASTAGVEQTLYALENGLLPNQSWVRPWEFLSAESFAHAPETQQAGPFTISAGLWQHALPDSTATAYDLGIHISAPQISREQRQNLVLTLVVDVSGSMNNASGINNRSESLLEVAQAGLRTLPHQLKAGDKLNLVSFSTEAKVLLENWIYQGDPSAFLAAVNGLRTEGGTNLNAGLNQAYTLARAQFQPDAINRVVMLTDAYANRGQIDASVIAQHTRHEDREGIYFSGLGFGADFNEAFLNELTEAGKGSYFSIITSEDAERSFGERFMALVNVAARDVRFRLDYPASLKHSGSAAEERSQVATEVQPVHFSYNTAQFFLERFQTEGEQELRQELFSLTLNYLDPITLKAQEAIVHFPLEQIRNQNLTSLKDARLVLLLTEAIRGQLSAAQARAEMEQLLASHSSPLASRYKTYLETWLKLTRAP